jgi:hypothetical protein
VAKKSKRRRSNEEAPRLMLELTGISDCRGFENRRIAE